MSIFNVSLRLLLFVFFISISGDAKRVLRPSCPHPKPHQNHQHVGPAYAVIYPGKVVPNSAYIVTVGIGVTKKETNVTATITGFAHNNKKIASTLSDILKPNETKMLQLTVGNFVAYRRCTLRVQASGGVNFNLNSRDLVIESKQHFLFIQTDKPIYKPGQVVKFRVLALDEHLLPIKNGNLWIRIQDSQRNTIKLFSDKPKNGIVSKKLMLSDQVVLGNWQIYVNYRTKNHNYVQNQKYFEVKKYVLPTFEVNVNVPKIPTIKSPNVLVTVSAKYTYGKPVISDLTLSLFDSNLIYVKNRYVRRMMYELRAKFKGEITVAIPMSVFNVYHQFYQQQYHLQATVKDELSGRIFNASKEITLYKHEYSFELISQRQFQPGVPFEAVFKVSYRDGRPVENNGSPLTIIYGFGWRTGDFRRKVSAVPKNGIVSVMLDTSVEEQTITTSTMAPNVTAKNYVYFRKSYPPTVDRNSISFVLKYKNNSENVGSIYVREKLKGCDMYLNKLNDSFGKTWNVGEKLELSLAMGTQLESFTYQIIGRKSIAVSKTLRPKGLQFNFTIDLKYEMIPEIRVLTFALCNKTLISSKVDVRINGVFKTPVKVTTTVNETKPGSVIDVIVESSPNSTIGLLGVDKRMLLLRDDNDIGKQQVMMEMRKRLGCKGTQWYSTCINYHHHYYRHYWNYGWFMNSGLLVFTNIKNNNNYYNNRYGEASMVSTIGSARGRMSRKASRHMRYGLTPSNTATHSTPNVRLRSHFPETWLWEIKETHENGKLVLTRKIPDTITSWYINAFAINEKTGLGLNDDRAKITVYQPFHVKAILPYLVIRGETVEIPVVVYNNLKKNLKTTVTMKNERNEFVFNAVNITTDVTKNFGSKSKVVTVPAGEGVALSFTITTKKVGYIDIKVSAFSDEVGDMIAEKLLVKPEGKTHYVNKALFIALTDDDSKFNTTVAVEMPKDRVPDSERVTVTAVGDILGPALNNLQRLLRMPFGCGEQNMINFVPNILVLDYLTKAHKLTHKIRSQAILHMEKGYQRELTYAHNDGSFSAFGPRDKNGCTWLTAFVIKSLSQAQRYISIDYYRIQKGIQFLMSKQKPDGSFVENGNVFHKEMQSGVRRKACSLTAYVAIALKKVPRNQQRHLKPMGVTENYLSECLDGTEDVYDISIITYALHLMQSSKNDAAFEKLMKAAKKSNDQLYWGDNSTKSYVSIEMTSYALMTMMLRNMKKEALPVLHWLIAHQNSRGGFQSTQDTVIGIEALASIAKKVSVAKPAIEINVSANDVEPKKFKINKFNSITLQELHLPSNTKNVMISANGLGSCIVQVAYQYNLKKSNTRQWFKILQALKSIRNGNAIELTACTRTEGYIDSGMAIMEIHLPSGFLVDTDSLRKSSSNPNIKRVDVSSSNAKVDFYFEKISPHKTCVSVVADRNIKVTNLKPIQINVYDYYDKSKTATIFYDLEPKKMPKDNQPTMKEVKPDKTEVKEKPKLKDEKKSPKNGGPPVIRDS